MSIKSEIQQIVATHIEAIDNAKEIGEKLIITPVNSGGGNSHQLMYEQVQIERRLEVLADRGFVVEVIDLIGAGKRYEVERAPKLINIRDLPLEQQLRVDSAMRPTGNDVVDLLMRQGEELPLSVDLKGNKAYSSAATELAQRLHARGWKVLAENSGGIGNLSKICIEAAPAEAREVTENVVAELTNPTTTSGSRAAEYRANRERIEARNKAVRKMQIEKAIAAKRAEIAELEKQLD